MAPRGELIEIHAHRTHLGNESRIEAAGGIDDNAARAMPRKPSSQFVDAQSCALRDGFELGVFCLSEPEDHLAGELRVARFSWSGHCLGYERRTESGTVLTGSLRVRRGPNRGDATGGQSHPLPR